MYCKERYPYITTILWDYVTSHSLMSIRVIVQHYLFNAIWNYVEVNVSINSSYTSFKNAIKCHLLGNNVNNLFRSVKFSH